MDKFDAIVPTFNEANRIKNVLRVLTSSKYINNIIVVDDGSTDDTSAQLKKFLEIHLLQLEKNHGKGEAVQTGLTHVTTPAVFLFDADLLGLKEENIQAMYDAYCKSPTSLIIGLRQKSRFYIQHWLRAHILPLIAGERLLPTDDLREIMKNKGTAGYGLEPHMNHYFRKNKKKIKTVLLQGVNDVPKWKKSTYGLRPQIKEGVNIVKKYIEIYAR
jgi:glycosyltransferase involved in cell wall biosynthesis